MNPVVLIVIAAVVVVLIVSLVAYKLGFRLTKLKARLGLVEAEMTRLPDAQKRPDVAETPEPAGALYSQEAIDGGVVRKSSIKAPASPQLSASQRAEGQGSRIDDSHIEIK